MTARDLVYGRRGGGWVPDGAAPSSAVANAPLCDVCSFPMVAATKGQRRHFVCSPPLECCGYPIDLVADLDAHRRAHAEMDAERAEGRLR